VKISKEELEQLKKNHPADLYEGEIIFSDEENKSHIVEFIYRKPKTGDMEALSKTQQRNPVVGNLNLIQSLIVYPDSGGVIERIRDYPAAMARFVEEAIVPFFGAGVMVRSRKI
jgi:hypothetical protein